ncbi:hypothetical protein K9N50_05955 [bacterium]|nr:hypothetical protein [bacterium]
MQVENKLFRALLIAVIAFGMLFTIGCLGDDDEDSPSGPGDDKHDGDLIGTWYRYSMTEDGVNNYYPSKVVLESDGTGTEYTLDAMDDDTEEITFDFAWETANGVFTVSEVDSSLEIWSGDYNVNSDIVTFNDNSGYRDVYVKLSTDIDSKLISTWYFVSVTVDGDIDNEMVGDVFTINSDKSWSMVSGGDTYSGNWFVNGDYFVIVDNESPNYSYNALTYEFSDNDSAVTLTMFNAYPDNYEWEHQTIVSVLSKTENSSNPGDETHDPELVGTWHAWEIDGKFVPTKAVLNGDGTGTSYEWDDENDLVITDNFLWETPDDVHIVIYDEDNVEVWSGAYSVEYDGVWVRFNHTSGETQGQTDFYVKDTGERDQNFTGEWIPWWENSLPYTEEKLVFNANGSGTSAWWDEDGEMVESDDFNWSTASEWLVVELDEFGGLAQVVKYEFSGVNQNLKIFFVDDEGTEYEKWYRKGSDAKDQAFLGDWTLTSRTTNGNPDPEIPDATMHFDNGTGTALWEGEPVNFQWTTSMNYIFSYQESRNYEVGWSYKYLIQNDELTLDVYDAETGVLSKETWTKQ